MSRAARRRVRLFSVIVAGIVLATAATAYAFFTTSSTGTVSATGTTLHAPTGVGSNGTPTTGKVPLKWNAPDNFTPASYSIQRCQGSCTPSTTVASGGCASPVAAPSCDDTDPSLTPNTTYTYTVTAKFSVSSAWTSVSATFQTSTAGTAPSFTSASSTTFTLGAAGTFTVTTTGSPTVTSITNANFTGCSVSALPSGVTVTDNHNGTATLAGTPGAGTSGTYTLCLTATNGVTPSATQTFTLTVNSGNLVITSSAVSGATSATPNLGPITVQRQTASGTPITTGSVVVTLSSSSAGKSFGASQFGASVTTVTIPNGASSATFWYGDTNTGTPTLTLTAPSFVSGSQQETITAAPAGLGISITGGTGSPSLSCGSVGASYTCTVSGTGNGGNVVFKVTFVDSTGTQRVYSATQASTISETGQNTGSATISANTSISAATLTASHSGSATKTSTLTFGPYTLTINVTS